MIRRYYKCTLLSDLVLNASLKTEGNMETLDYIPGSNFLGILAQRYETFGDQAYEIFHSGNVKFSNAYPLLGDHPSYPISFDMMKPKLSEGLHLNHKTNHSNPEIREKQLKQQRSGFITKQGEHLKNVEQDFVLKSAFDSEKRRSKDSQMFGFRTICESQSFYFFIEANDNNLAAIHEHILGVKYVGKSKTAEFGKVKIEEFTNINQILATQKETKHALVYAVSDLSFMNEFGHASYTPTYEQLGFSSGNINWEKSSVRTKDYSPWNTMRGISSTERHCIAKGSVFYIEDPIPNRSKKDYFVGEYNFDGLGHVIVNPEFLMGGIDNLEVFVNEKNAPKPIVIQSSLGKYLNQKSEAIKSELKQSETVAEIIKQMLEEKSHWKLITSSQWGGIRSIAEKKSEDQIYSEIDKFISSGIGYQKYWSKNEDRLKTKLLKLIEGQRRPFIVKLASEAAKQLVKDKYNTNG